MNLMTLTVVLFALGGIVFLWIIATYNSVVDLRGQAQRAWSNVDVALKQRWDLIPNLIAAVKGYARHEREVLERITELRSVALAAPDRGQRIEAEREASRLIPTLLMQVERYPNLQASNQFLHLQHTLTNLETHISDRRELYNEAAANYNVYRHSFPALLVAHSLGPEDMPLFEAAPHERTVPLVEF